MGLQLRALLVVFLYCGALIGAMFSMPRRRGNLWRRLMRPESEKQYMLPKRLALGIELYPQEQFV